MIIDIVPWLSFAGLICAAIGFSWAFGSQMFYCRDNPSMLPGIALTIIGVILIYVGASNGASLFPFLPDLGELPTATNTTCMWVNTSTSTAWICPVMP